MDEQVVQDLYEATLTKHGIESLSDIQAEKFRRACQKALQENPDYTFEDTVVVATYYLKLILDYPDASF